MALLEKISENKMITAIVAALIGGGGLSVAGIELDVPAMKSDVQIVMEQSVENQLDILHIQLKFLREAIWEMEDRIEAHGLTAERKQRLRNLQVEFEFIQLEIEIVLGKFDENN